MHSHLELRLRDSSVLNREAVLENLASILFRASDLHVFFTSERAVRYDEESIQVFPTNADTSRVCALRSLNLVSNLSGLGVESQYSATSKVGYPHTACSVSGSSISDAFITSFSEVDKDSLVGWFASLSVVVKGKELLVSTVSEVHGLAIRTPADRVSASNVEVK